ncbi:MAG: PDZ domain-containing protein [Deltaproteobacteria bacterium]|nr:PDZ domain-containing protein [Deltaproteobacteria bacterium]
MKRRLMQPQSIAALSLGLALALGGPWGVGLGLPAASVPTLFDEAAELLMPKGADSRLTAERDALRAQLGAAPNYAQSRLALSQLRREIGGLALEAQLLSSEEQKYWVDAACFGGELDTYPVRHIGAWFERRGRRWFVQSVLAGGPAADAGIVRGDEILTVNGQPFAPVASFRDVQPAAQVQLGLRRLPWEAPRQIKVTVTSSSMAEALKRHQTLGSFVRQVGGRRVMYAPLPLTCHRSLETALAALAVKAQAQADALVLDLRGDFADGGLTFAAPFISLPTSKDTAASPLGLAPFAKKLVLLVDAGTRGGREQLAAFLQQRGRAVLVGTTTAGATRAGRAVSLGDGGDALLWLPRGDGGGAPLVPDVAVEAALVYAAGGDAILDQGLAQAALTAAPRN